MTPDKLDDWLEQALSEDDYIADDGFTDRVMARLPSEAVSRRRVRGFNAAATVLALVVVALVFPWTQILQAMTGLSVEAWLSVAAALGAAFTGIALGGAMWSLKRAP